MVLAVTKLKQTGLGHTPIAAAGGRVEADAGGLKVVDAQSGASESTLKRGPSSVIAEQVQQTGEAVVGEVVGLDRLSSGGLQGEQARGSPGLDVIEAMVAFREHIRQPDGGNPSDAQSLPIAVLMKVLFEQAGQIHAAKVSEQQRKIIHTFGGDGNAFGHAESVRQSS